MDEEEKQKLNASLYIQPKSILCNVQNINSLSLILLSNRSLCIYCPFENWQAYSGNGTKTSLGMQGLQHRCMQKCLIFIWPSDYSGAIVDLLHLVCMESHFSPPLQYQIWLIYNRREMCTIYINIRKHNNPQKQFNMWWLNEFKVFL